MIPGRKISFIHLIAASFLILTAAARAGQLTDDQWQGKGAATNMPPELVQAPAPFSREQVQPPMPPILMSNTPEESTGMGDDFGDAKSSAKARTGHTWVEITFSCAILIFGFSLIVVLSFLAVKSKLSENSVFKLIGITIVVTAGLFVIPAGYSQNQMSPLMGLLGAIAGYLLGKESDKK